VKPPRPRRLTHRYQLGVAELAAAAAGNLVQQYIKLARSLPGMLGAVRNVLMPLDEATGRRRLKRPGKLPLAPRTPLNVSITNARAFAMRSVPLEQLKQIARTGGFSLNDVVMAVCAGALKRYLADYEALPKKPLVAAVPVSLREQGNADMNNQVSFMTVSLATDRDDPLERLKGIRESADAGKQVSGRIKGALPMDFPSFGVPWLMTGLVSLHGRSGLANRLPQPGNLVISNVPGPQMPLYLAGAAIRSYAPVSIPAHGMALNVTVQSYNGSMEFGLIACRRAVPDVADLADYMMREIEVLAHATAHAAAQAAEAASTPAAESSAPNRRRAKAALKLLPKQVPDAGEPPRRAGARGRRQAAAA
jgi:WS/DGAT/MGAT family acyltransferase